MDIHGYILVYVLHTQTYNKTRRKCRCYVSHFSRGHLVIALFIPTSFPLFPSAGDLGSLGALLSRVSYSFLSEDSGTFLLQSWFSFVCLHLIIPELVKTKGPQEMSSDLDVILSCPKVEDFLVFLVVQINRYSPHGNSLLQLLTRRMRNTQGLSISFHF